MSLLDGNSLLHFEQLTCVESQECQVLTAKLQSLTIENHPATEIHNTDLFQSIQCLDDQLVAHAIDKCYDKALESALEMQKRAPESYYGYHRAAQLRLLQNEYQEIVHAYTRGFKAVNCGIELLYKSAENTQHIFDQAAAELGEKGLFDKANEIATWMIMILPASPTGYLRAGELYEAQNTTEAALQIYEQSIASVSRENRDVIVERMRSLQQRINKTPLQRDIIVRMPLEIITEIAQYLDVNDLITCMKTCKSWQERIEQCREAWRILEIPRYSCQSFDLTMIQNVKQFVHSVSINSYSNSSIIEDLLVTMGNGDFRSLTHLSIGYYPIKARCVPHLLNVFSRIKLTRLDLSFNYTDTEEDTRIPFDQVLVLCTHLEELTYHTSFIPLSINYALLPKRPTIITRLAIGCTLDDYGERPETPHFFIPLVPLFPHLVDLCITDCSPGDLQIITEQCRNLRRLLISSQLSYKSLSNFLEIKNPPKGLQYLEVDGYIDPKDVALVIAKFSKTLITISIDLRYECQYYEDLVDPNWDWKSIPKVDFPLLREMHFFLDYHWPFEQWIGDCPALEVIRLEGITESTDSILNIFRRLPKLQSLILSQCDKLTDAGLSKFFTDLKNQGSQLHTVSIKSCDSPYSEALLSLIALQSLRCLRIGSCGGIIFQSFVERVDRANNLERLSLCSLDDITDQTLLKLICNLPQLKRLNLYHLHRITDNVLSAIACDSTSKISKIDVVYCRGLTKGGIENAKKRLDILEDYQSDTFYLELSI